MTANRFSGRALHAGDVLEGFVSRDAAVDVYGVDAERLDAAVAAWSDAGA